MANALQAGNTAPTGVWKQIQQLIAGILKDVPPGSVFVVNGQTYTQAQLVTLLQGYLTLFVDSMTAKLEYLSKLKARDAQEATARDTYAGVKAAIVAMFGRRNSRLGDFGWNPHAPKPLTTEQKQLRAAKAMVTREKRHTMSKKAKAGLKATGVPTVLVGPDGTKVIPAEVDRTPSSGSEANGSAGSATGTPAPASSNDAGPSQ